MQASDQRIPEDRNEIREIRMLHIFEIHRIMLKCNNCLFSMPMQLRWCVVPLYREGRQRNRLKIQNETHWKETRACKRAFEHKITATQNEPTNKRTKERKQQKRTICGCGDLCVLDAHKYTNIPM